MNVYIVKVDNQHAKIYTYPEGMSKPHLIDEKHSSHHTHSEKDAIKNNKDKFFHQIATYIENNCKEVFILGSKVVGAEFKHHLENHHHAALAKKVIGVEVIEGHATDAEVFTKTKEFFKHYKSFTPNY